MVEYRSNISTNMSLPCHQQLLWDAAIDAQSELIVINMMIQVLSLREEEGSFSDILLVLNLQPDREHQ